MARTKTLTAALATCLFAAVTLPAFASDITTPAGFMAWRTPDALTVEMAIDVLDDRYDSFPDLKDPEPGPADLAVTIRLINRYTDNPRVIVDAIQTGYADDSVSGGWERFMLAPTDNGGFSLVSHGWKWKCGRGELADQWVGRSCP
ncbi:MAG: hypothetical protein AAFO77_00190 [Pseudomonadota bacterium]